MNLVNTLPRTTSSSHLATNPNYSHPQVTTQLRIGTSSGTFTQPHTYPSVQQQNTTQNGPQTVPFSSRDSQSIQHLQAPDAEQAEQITSLLIRIAVLENSLSHAKCEKDAISNSLQFVIESLSRFHNSSSSSHICQVQNGNVDAGVAEQVKGLEKEIERLRKENRGLRRRVQDHGSRSHALYAEGGRNDFGGEGNLGCFGAGTTIQTSTSSSFDKGNGKGKGKERVQASFDSGNGNGNGIDIGLESEKFIGSWANSNPNFDDAGARGGSAELSFVSGSGSTTVPNTPIPDAHTTAFNASFADVGLHSLEENMDGFPSPVSVINSFSSGKGVREGNGTGGNEGGDGEEEKNIDAHLEEQRAVMVRFNNMPKPGVLKVGFEVEGSKRGEEYDFTCANSNKALSYTRTGSVRDHNRFAIPSLPKDASLISSFFSHHLFQERDEEDAQGFQQAGGLTLWHSPEEREYAIRIHQGMVGPNATKNFVDFFRYGIFYFPSKADTNYLRTIHLSNLPSSIKLRDVLARVRGGEIVSAMLLDTLSLTGGKTAIVQFMHECAAAEYVSYVQHHRVLFGEERVPAIVTLVQTPTWPLSIPSRRRMLEHKQTRCLFIYHFPPDIDLENMVRDLAYGNAFRAASLVSVEMNGDGTLWLEFASVNAAGAAFGILTSRKSYAGLVVGFSDDPCARPLEDILSPVPLKTSMVPRVDELGTDEELKIDFQKSGGDFESNNRLSAHSREVQGIGGFKGFEFQGAGLGGELIERQRKRLAALSNQKVEIPSFSGRAIEGPSWADEVIEAQAGDIPFVSSPVALTVPPNSPVHDLPGFANSVEEGNGEERINEKINATMFDNVNKKWFQGPNNWLGNSGPGKPPTRLARNKYARLVPAFEDLGERPRINKWQSIRSPKFPALSTPVDQSTESNSTSIFAETHQSETLERREGVEKHHSNCSDSESPKSTTQLTLREIALHRLALLNNHAPIPISMSILSDKKPEPSPLRVKLQDLLTSSSDSSSSASDGSISSPLKSNPRRKVVDMGEVKDEIDVEGPIRMPKGPGGFGFDGGGKGVGEEGKELNGIEMERYGEMNMRGGVRNGNSAQSVNAKRRMNPDEIFLDDEKVELGQGEGIELQAGKEQGKVMLEKLIRGETIRV